MVKEDGARRVLEEVKIMLQQCAVHFGSIGRRRLSVCCFTSLWLSSPVSTVPNHTPSRTCLLGSTEPLMMMNSMAPVINEVIESRVF